MKNYPSYITIHEKGQLEERIKKALSLLEKCTVCPRACKVNRLKGETKVCKTGRYAVVSSIGPHFGEEMPLVGRRGSGTIFFTHCNLGCLFCQNYDISHLGHGVEVAPKMLAEMMLRLQGMGCHNINFVTPTHVTPMILEALPHAIEGGLKVPLVYNCGGYESVDTLKLLDGIVDIYMPDIKYTGSEPARAFSNAKDYPEKVKAALKEMHRQVGALVLDNKGIAVRGLLVRHLVLPGGLAGTEEAMRFLADDLSPDTYVNVMDQYRPCYEAFRHPPLDRGITIEEYQEALLTARGAGLYRLDGYWSHVSEKGGANDGNDDYEGVHCVRRV